MEVDLIDFAPVAVVDREGWIKANVDGFQILLGPLLDRVAARRGPSGLTHAVGSRVTGAEVGAVLAYLAGRVLGQYELFLPPGQGTGRLTLVAPNIVATERALGVDPHDFRLWVCLHEVTHRTQFTATPWLRDYMQTQINAYIDATDIEPGAVLSRLRSAAGEVVRSVRERTEVNLIEAVQTPEQRVVLDRISAVMTLVEGHGEFVMDGVGPEVVPTVEEIRRRFDVRRRPTGPVDRTLRKLLGIDIKMKQYAEGARFVRAVVADSGIGGFNRVWESTETLPTKSEIAQPSAWIERVIGQPAVTA